MPLPSGSIDVYDLRRFGSESFSRIARWTLTRRPFKSHLIGTTQLRNLCQNNGSFYQIRPSQTFQFDPPDDPSETPSELQKVSGPIIDAEVFVGELRDCQLVGPHGLTVDNRGRYVLENAVRSENLIARSFIGALKRGQIPVRTSRCPSKVEVAVSLLTPWATNFFHWFSECLPRLKGVLTYVEQTGRRPLVLVPPDPPKWMIDSLRFLDLSDEVDFAEWHGTRVRVDRLVVPSVEYIQPLYGRGFFATPPDGLEWVGGRIRNFIDSSNENYSTRIYISRNDARERRVVNESAVMSALEPLGFESHTLSELSLESQVRLFSEADVVVAPHGAGLTNVIYSRDTALVELFGSYVNSCYFRMARGLGHEYACLLADPVGSNMFVPVERLQTLVTRFVD